MRSFAPLLDRPAVGRLDAAAERLADRGRRIPALNRAMYVLTGWGDSSTIWHLAGVVGAVRRDYDVEYAMRLSSVQGLEAGIVNGPIKWIFRRERPEVVSEHAHSLRVPRTSSFPSGHASAAGCAVVMLWEGAGPVERLGWTALGGAVAWSRVHVGVHHASDMLAGVSIGVGLGLLARRLWPLR